MNNDESDNLRISVRYGELETVLDWCSMNCSKDWDLAEITEMSGASNGIYQFHFVDSKDQLLFLLRWQ